MELRRICYFGGYEAHYPRNQILRKGLELNGVTVRQVRVSPRLSHTRKALELVSKFRTVRRDYQVLFLAEMNFFMAPIAWALSKWAGVPLVVDHFFSLYDSMVEDRKTIARRSIRAAAYRFSDKTDLDLGDLVIADTNEHLKYYVGFSNANPQKLKVIHIGADDETFYPKPISIRKKRPFTVVYFGKFIPLHGVDHIVGAANLLRGNREIRFELYGSGQTYPEVQSLVQILKLENLSLMGSVPQNDVPSATADADLVLGIFGTTPKTGRVIPHKVFQGLAMKKPVLTADSPAIREIFTPGIHLETCEAGSAEDLAQNIVALSRSSERRKELGHEGFNLFKAHLTPVTLGAQLKEAIEGAV